MRSAPAARRAGTSSRSCRSGSRATACSACRWSQSALDDEDLTIHETPLPPLAAAVLASLASAVAPHLPSVGVLVSLLPELEARAARLHLAGQRQRAERAGARRSASTSRRSPRAARSASRPIPSRPCTSSAATAPASRCRRSSAPRGWRSATTAATWPGSRPSTRALGNLEVRAGRADPERPDVVGHRQAGRERRLPGRRGRGWRPSCAQAADPWTCRWCREQIARSPCPLCGHRGRPPRRRALLRAVAPAISTAPARRSLGGSSPAIDDASPGRSRSRGRTAAGRRA